MAVVLLAAGLTGLQVPGLALAGVTAPVVPVPTSMSVSGQATDTGSGQGIAGLCAVVDDLSAELTVATATTGSDGRYTASWSQTGSTTAHRYGIALTPDCGAQGRWLPTPDQAYVTLTAAPGKTSATGVALQTSRAGRIIGTITDDATGKPVAGVPVRWFGGGTPPTNAVPEVTTAADGTFVAGGLPAGTYSLAINGTRHVSGTDDTLVRPLMTYLADDVHHVPEGSNDPVEEFTVTVGTDVTVNESIHAADAVTGTVTDALTGLPLSGVHVTAFGTSVWNLSMAYTEGYTDSLGRYRIDGLGPGSYQICFEPDQSQISPVSSACWKDKPFAYPASGADPLQVDGFGTVVANVNQSLARA